MKPREYGIVARETLVAQSGLAFLTALIAGEHPAPPFSRVTGILATEAEEGRVTFTGDPSEGFLNPNGTVHGGWTSALLDSAMACAVHSTLKAGEAYTSVEMKVNFVRPILPKTGLLTCIGRVVHRGGPLATAEGHVRDAEGRLYAHGTETCMIFAPRT